MTVGQKWQLLNVQGSSVEKRKVFMVWLFFIVISKACIFYACDYGNA